MARSFANANRPDQALSGPRGGAGRCAADEDDTGRGAAIAPCRRAARVGGSLDSSSSDGNIQTGSVTIPDVEAIRRDYSSSLAAEAGNATVSINGGGAPLMADASQPLTGFNISSSFFNGINQTEMSSTPTAWGYQRGWRPGHIAANFLDDYSSSPSNLLWHIVDASSIDFQRQARGSILGSVHRSRMGTTSTAASWRMRSTSTAKCICLVAATSSRRADVPLGHYRFDREWPLR